MTAPAELSAGVLLRVADFLKKLPADQLADLASGTARLEVVPKGASAGSGSAKKTAAPRAVKAPTQRAAKIAPVVDAERVRADLRAIGDRAAAARYLDDLGLNVPPLKSLAKELGVAVGSRARRDEVRDAIVQRFVGGRLAAEAVSRPDAVRS